MTDSGGSPLQHVTAAFYRGGQRVIDVFTDDNGDYRMINLNFTANYQLCFDGSTALDTEGNPVPGVSAECYDDVLWDGGSPPVDATDIQPPAGEAIFGIDAELDS